MKTNQVAGHRIHVFRARADYYGTFNSSREFATVTLHHLGHASASLTPDEARQLGAILIEAATEAEAK